MIRVLIVDDSWVARAHLAHMLASDPEIQVIGSVSGGEEALAFVERQKPDVITMDINMSGMDGFTATRRIMETSPVPIIIVSAVLDPADQANSFKVIDAGAVACLSKPPGIGDPNYESAKVELIATVKQMSEVKVIRRWPKRQPAPAAEVPVLPLIKTQIKLVALGASTGGPPAVRTFLAHLSVNFPLPIVLVQHIAKGFTQGFVEWLNSSSPLPVSLAIHHETLVNGRVYVAPADLQMGVTAAGHIELIDAPLEHHLRPSASYLFRSVAEAYGQAAVGILLTGMGADGAVELKQIKDAGGTTFAQDKASSIVFGMPGEAIRLGAVDHVCPPETMATTLTEMIRRQKK